MPAVTRITDPLSTGHPCTPADNLSGHATDGTVTIEGLTAAVIGAPHPAHTFVPPCVAVHVTTLAAGSPTVRVNGIPLGRIGDSIDAGAMTGGASTVFADSGGAGAAANPTFTTVTDSITGDTTFSVIQPDGTTSYTVTY